MTKKVLQERLSESLKEFKNNTAIEYGNRHITYVELERRANYITYWLINRGFKKETFIGILINDRVEFIVTMIGVLNAGCVFVPLDSAYPKDRVEVMIKSTDVRFVIVDKVNFNQFGVNGNQFEINDKQCVEFILLDDLFLSGNPWWSTHLPAVEYCTEDKIYIYFTSGSTGKPLAIVGKNKSLVHYAQWEMERFNIDQGFRISQFSTVGFDAFLKEVFVTLFSGGTLCIPEDLKIILYSEELLNWLEQYSINLLHCVPSVFRILNSDRLNRNNLRGLKYVLLSGESIYPAELKKWYDIFDEKIQIVNLYGLTETTILKTCYFIKKRDLNKKRIPIGKPIKGARIIILDKDMNICN